jgi:DNA-binding NarL/FixJ family response regulator
MKILLVDDHPLFLEGMQSFLLAHGVEVSGTARNGLEAILKYEAHYPDVVLMDLQMAGCDGIETTRMIRKEYPEARIVILTACEDETSLSAAVGAGAVGYLLKGMEPDEFLRKLEGIGRGEAPLADALAGKVLQQLAHPEMAEKPNKLELSERQLCIIQSLAKGLSYKEIADLLNLRETTIKYHFHEILAKLQLNNKAQLIAYAVKNKLIE